MTPEQMKFAYDLVLGKVSYEEFVRGTGLDPVGQSDAIEPELRDADISYEEFVRRTGLDPVGQPGFIEQALRDALLSQDAPTLSRVLSYCWHFKLLTPSCAQLLAALLLQPWHQEHEDLAHVLQGFRVPATADTLAQVALIKHDYLKYNNSNALARKCIWALADIGTPEARSHLEHLAYNSDRYVAVYAQRRLNRWQEELHRKGEKF